MEFGHSETYTTTLVDDNGSDEVSINLSIEGLKIMDRSGRLTKRKIPLDHITRWTRSPDKLTMFVKTPVDVEEKAVSFYSNHHTLTSLLDSLTSFCLQLVEIMEAKQHTDAANEMRAVANNGGRRYKQLKNADEVEFWMQPEKEGWLHSQGEVIKTWRKRWFVLKDGFLFRFLDDKVTATSKPRGIVDLSKAGQIEDGKSITGRANTIKVTREKGHVVYLADSETEMVEWMSALEGAVSRLMRIIAGVDDEQQQPSHTIGQSNPSRNGNLSQSSSDFRPQQSWQQQDTRSSYGIQGSANYPGVAPLPTAPQIPGYRGDMAGFGSGGAFGGGGGGVYRDELGVSYGLGTGTTVGGVAGVGGYRQGNSGGMGAPSQLPSTISVADPQFAAPQQQSMPPQPSYGSPAFHGSCQSYTPQPAQPPAPSLPDTVNVMSIMDQPPLQQPTYGVSGASAHMHNSARSAPPAAPPAPMPRWETLYTPDGRPYYHNPSTGETSWEPR